MIRFPAYIDIFRNIPAQDIVGPVDIHAFNDAPEFPEVARPVVQLQGRKRMGGEKGFCIVFFIHGVQDPFRVQGNIFPAFAQGGDADRINMKKIVYVLAERCFADAFKQVVF